MEIHCYGDSHTKYFGESTTMRWGGYKRDTEPKVHERSMIAASAKGFQNAEKSRFAFRKFTRLVAEDNPLFICMNLGLVDADAGIYFRKYVKNTKQSLEADLAPTFKGYVEQVAKTVADCTIIFKGLNPSTISVQHYFDSYVFRNITKRVTQEEDRIKVDDLMKENPTTIAQHAKNNCEAAELLKDAVEKAGLYLL